MRIIYGPNDKFQWESVDCMCKGTQFPGAEVRRHEDYATTTTQTFEIILESIVNDEAPNVPFIQFPEVRELDEQAPEVLKTPS